MCCFYWFHPLVWICLAEMKRSGEEACDDVVLTAGVEAPEYAEQLLEVIRIMKLNVLTQRGHSPVSVAMAQPAQIHNRLGAILEPLRNRSGIRRSSVLAAAAVTFCVAPIAALHVSAQSTPPSHSNSSGATTYRHAEQSNSAARTNAHKKSASHQEAAAKTLAARVKQQASVIAKQQQEIVMLRKAAEKSRVQAHDRALSDYRLKMAAAEAGTINEQLARQSADLSRQAQELSTNELARSKSQIDGASAELRLRQAEIADLTANLDRTKALNKAGVASSSEINEAMARIEHAQAELLKRQAELSDRAIAGAARPAEMQKLQAAMEAAMANLQRIRAQYGAGFTPKSELDAAQAAAKEAQADLQQVRDQLQMAKAQAEAAQKAAQDAAQKKPGN